jgi:Protein of unknown function (DUF2905)
MSDDQEIGSVVEIGRTLIILGIVIFGIGVLLTATEKIPFLGKLPGDILIKKDGFTLYFPLATSIVISILLTLLLRLFDR